MKSADNRPELGFIRFANRVTHENDNGKDAQHGSQGQVQAIDPRNHEREGPMLPRPETQAGDDIQNTRSQKPRCQDQIQPLENGEELCRWQRLLLVRPYLRKGEDGVEQGVMAQQAQNPEQRQSCTDEMEYREEVEMVRVDLALVSGDRWQVDRKSVV